MSKAPSPRRTWKRIDALRGVTQLALEATQGVTDLVEEMHRTIGGGPKVLGRPLERPTNALTGLVYGSIRGVTKMVGTGLDRALGRLSPLLGEGAAGPEREAVLAALNGVLGDYLDETGNPLAIQMQMRCDGQPLQLERRALRAALPGAGAKVVVLVHGSCLGAGQWNRLGHDHGAALARDLGYTPVYLNYNSGLHISTNGHAFAHLLEQLVLAWPAPLDDLTILGHSMGGLVARSACHSAEGERLVWRKTLRNLVCLGSPHHGSPLERAGNWFEYLLGVSRYSLPLARLGHIRSAGVTDLRFGYVLDEDWEGQDRFARVSDHRHALPLPGGVSCYAIAGTSAREHRAKLPGDGLVPVNSALGIHEKRELTLAFPEGHRRIAYGTRHFDLLSQPEVYQQIRSWLSS